jgi:hypothetical protein
MFGGLDKVEHRKADSRQVMSQGFEACLEQTAVAGSVLRAALARNENKKEISGTGRKPKNNI